MHMFLRTCHAKNVLLKISRLNAMTTKTKGSTTSHNIMNHKSIEYDVILNVCVNVVFTCTCVF